MVKKYTRKVKIDHSTKRKYPKIEVIDMQYKSKFYNCTQIILDNKEKYYVNWRDKQAFLKGFADVKRHYSFTNDRISSIRTKTHRYASTSFTAKGFKP